MFNQLTTITVGLRYGSPACDLKGTKIPRDVAVNTIVQTLKEQGIEAFTLIECKGYWEGQPEDSFKVEVVSSDPSTRIGLHKAALKIKDYLLQDAVLLTHQDIFGNLV